VLVGVATLTTTAALIVGGAATAQAAGTPPYEPDPSAVASLSFFDAGGHQVITGSINDAPFATYVQASGAVRAGDTKATLFAALPKNGQAIGAWTSNQLTASTIFPVATPPGQVSATLPVVTVGTGDTTLAQLVTNLPNTAVDAYQGLYQLRVKTSAAGAGTSTTYAAADIFISGSTWTQVYPAPTLAPTTTTITSITPASGSATLGSSVTITAGVAAGAGTPANGSVQFFDGATLLGSQPWTGGTSVSLATTALGGGSRSITATYVPVGPFSGSTSAVSTYVIKGLATSISVAVNAGTATAYKPVVLNATVTPATVAGTVTFTDGATVIGTTSAGTGSFSLTTSTLGTGAHTISATFNPTDTASYSPSTTTAPAITLAPPGDQKTGQVDVNVPAGSITISTYYTGSDAAHTLHLDAAVLDPTGVQFTSQGQFGSAVDPTKGIVITDTRAGDLPWSATLQASDFAGPGGKTINAQNFGFTGVSVATITGNPLGTVAKPVVVSDIPYATTLLAAGAAGSAGLRGGGQFAAAANGNGSVDIYGSLVLRAPSATPTGTYVSTLTLTIS
jgi:hypothetical protein